MLDMIIGDRLRDLRETLNLSQGDIEKRTGLLRCYISRVENGHTVPSLDTLEKMASALEIPIYKLFHNGDGEPIPLHIKSTGPERLFGKPGEETRFLKKFWAALKRLNDRDQQLVMHLAKKMAGGRN